MTPAALRSPLRLFALLSRSEKRRLHLLTVVNVIAGFCEVVGVFSVIPFLAVVADPAAVTAIPVVHETCLRLGLSTDRQFLIASGVLTIVTILMANLVTVLALTYGRRTCFAIVGGVSQRLFEGYLSQPYTYFLSRNSGILGKDLLSEVYRLESTVLEPAATLAARGLTLLLIVAALVVYDWRAATLVGGVFGGFYIVIYRLLAHRVKGLGDRRFLADEQRFGLVAESLAGIKETRMFGREPWFAVRFREASNVMFRAQDNMGLLGTAPRYLLEASAYTLLVIVVLVVLWRGGDLADILPVLGLYAVAGLRLMPALQMVYHSSMTLASAAAILDRIAGAFDGLDPGSKLQPQSTTQERVPLTRSLAMRDVAFAYPGGDLKAVRGIDFEIPVRSCVGIAGPSGAGKTTTADLLLGLLEPTHGSVEVDGVPLNAATRPQWMHNVGYVPQHIYLSDASIAENIAYGVDPADIDFTLVERAARLASLHDFIVGKLPAGYRTEVGERGVRLSGGQRQRLAIARALYRDPDVLLFDEATSGLDTETEEAVVSAIQSLTRKKTIVLIAHRLSTLRHCDRVFCLRDGRMERVCTYRELVATQGSESPEIPTRPEKNLQDDSDTGTVPGQAAR